MKYLVITEIDADTKQPCIVEPMRTAPALPEIKGLVVHWADESTWPIEMHNGVYLRAPLYYATCDDDADVDIPGVLEVITNHEWLDRKHSEFYARRPHPSWTWNPETFKWSSPVPYPIDALHNQYVWDEPSRSWKTNPNLKVILE